MALHENSLHKNTELTANNTKLITTANKLITKNTKLITNNTKLTTNNIILYYIHVLLDTCFIRYIRYYIKHSRRVHSSTVESRLEVLDIPPITLHLAPQAETLLC